jgi:hypothetical protein
MPAEKMDMLKMFNSQENFTDDEEFARKEQSLHTKEYQKILERNAECRCHSRSPHACNNISSWKGMVKSPSLAIGPFSLESVFW